MIIIKIINIIYIQIYKKKFIRSILHLIPNKCNSLKMNKNKVSFEHLNKNNFLNQ